VNPLDLRAVKPTGILEANGVKPKLSSLALALHVNVGRLPTVRRIEEQAIRSDA